MAETRYILPDHIVASSDEMRELVSVVRGVAPTQITVLLMGESGTGKEVFARLIHDWSKRKDGPFVTVNCGAIPEGLIESELFGHEKGSFTGASAERKGFFEAAHGGTIFLDEIGEMPLAAQVKLLRVLETNKFTRVGSTKERETDARVIAATNRDLELEVRSGRFRADLYYRLRAVMLRIPPLRNRRDDIPFLIDSISRDIVKRHSLPHIPHIERSAIELLSTHEWRGNIRELKNVLEQLSVMAFSPSKKAQGEITTDDVERVLMPDTHAWIQSGQPLHPVYVGEPQHERSELTLIYKALIELRADLAEIKAHLNQGETDFSPSEKNERTKVRSTEFLALPASSLNGNAEITPVETLEQLELRAINEALARYNGNKKLAAQALGISERTLYRKTGSND